MNTNVVNALMNSKFGGFVKKAGYKLVKARPDIGLGIGIVGIAAGTVLACLKTAEAKEAIEETKEKLNDISEREENGEETLLKEKMKVYAWTVYKMARIYGVSAFLWFGGMGCVVGSHGDLKGQNARILANTAALKKFYDEYRERVAKELGEEKERQLYLGGNPDEVEVLEYNPETGATKITRKNVNTFDKQAGSIFARNFSAQTSHEFDVRTYANYFVEAKIENLKRKVRMGPFVTMNDVYDVFGMKNGFGRCKDGLDWGWTPEDEFIVTFLEGWEPVKDAASGRIIYHPCMRLDFNPKPLIGRI